MKKVLGLDIGISSVGFALIDEDNKKITAMGVHVFDAAENPKNGSSLALPRREKRGSRRSIRRRSMRKKAMYRLFKKQDFLNVDDIFSPQALSPWELRNEGLHRKLSDLEFARSLYHMAKHRGFKSNRKEGSKEEDTKMKKAMGDLNQAFMDSGKLTIGSYLDSLAKKRNSNGEYSHTVSREMVENEIDGLFEKQRGFEQLKATQEIQAQIKKIILFQRPLKSVDRMRGDCTHLPQYKRAPKFSFSAELFVFFSKLNNLKLLTASGEARPITDEMRHQLYLEALSRASINYSQIRKIWEVSEAERFNLVRYGLRRKSKGKDYEVEFNLGDFEKDKFFEFKGYHTLRKIIQSHDGNLWDTWKENIPLLDYISEIVSFEFDEKEIENKLRENASLSNVSKELMDKIIGINDFSKTVNLSIKAITILLPYLREGKCYYEAVSTARKKGQFTDHEKRQALNYLPPLAKTNNPVVDRAVAQARKIVNAVIARFGVPDAIHIELAREMGKSVKLRKDIEDRQKDNKEKNTTIKEKILKEFGHEARRDDVIKYKLWEEQRGVCAYSGKYIKLNNLFDGVTSEVDHILPYSRSYDDSYMNKVLVSTQFNRDKGNQTPYEKWGSLPNWEQLENFAQRLPFQKRRNFLLKNFEDVENDWKARHLNDTSYMARYLKEHIKGHFSNVETISGGITSYLRRNWGIGSKDRENDNKHHGADAAIIACASKAGVQRVTEFNKRLEWERLKKDNPEAKKPYTPAPWEGFRDDVLKSLDGLFVSRLSNPKLRGEAHAETIKSYRPQNPEGKQVVKRISLMNITSANLNDMVDKERNYKLFNLLKERLEAHGNDPKKAFYEPVYMPRNNGTEGPQIKGIRIYDNSKSGIVIRKGHTDNGNMVRVDVFSKPNKKGNQEYYLCPIYVMDVMKGELPNRVFVNKEYVEIDETYVFKFSLQKNDFIQIIKNDESNLVEGYFIGMHRGTGNINLVEHHKPVKEKIEGVGVKTVKFFKKYNINYFGERFLVKNETRQGLKLCKR